MSGEDCEDGVAGAFRKLERAFGAEPPDALSRALARAEGREAPFEAALRAAEALLFVSGEPLSAGELAERLGAGVDVGAVLSRLKRDYAGRGVELVEAGGKWRFQSAADLAFLFSQTRAEPKRLSKAALECLAIIAYHQPITRPEMEEVRGVSLSRGTLDLLLEIGWVRPRGRRRTPGRPLTYGTSEAFLLHFGLPSLDALPGKDDLKAAGLLDARAPPGLETPRPSAELAPDEDPLDPGDDGADFFVDHLAAPEG